MFFIHPWTARIAAGTLRLKSASWTQRTAGESRPNCRPHKRDATREVAAIIKNAKKDSTPKTRSTVGQTLADVKAIWREQAAQAPQRLELLNKAFSLSLEKALVAADYEVLRQLSRSEIANAFSRLEGKIRGGVGHGRIGELMRSQGSL
jgi:hypothetical protein